MKTKKLKLIKRALATVLTLTMALGIVPMTAFAEETSQAAQEAAAMRELESRVFTIADEEFTIEDLEQADFIMVTTENGENVTLSSDEIRDYLIVNPRVDIEIIGNISLSRTTPSTAQLILNIKANGIISKISGYTYCRNYNTSESYFQNSGTLYRGSSASPRTEVTLYFANFSLPQFTPVRIGYYGINVECTAGSGGKLASYESGYILS